MNSFLWIGLVASTALILDFILAEPKKWHPLVGFGRWANFWENQCYNNTKISGFLAWIGSVIPFVLIAHFAIATQPYTVLIHFIIAAAILYCAIGARSLEQHAMAIHKQLASDNIHEARIALSYIVSRDTTELTETEITKATIESILENGADATYAAIIWFAAGGVPGVILYRLSNTLDAMWGYKNDKYLWFGWFAAKFDDVMNYIPARCTALTYALIGNTTQALKCWKEQGTQWKSPNAGPVMSSGAGALNIALGGSAIYHGVEQNRSTLGAGDPPVVDDIKRAIWLLRKVSIVWTVSLLIVGLIFSL